MRIAAPVLRLGLALVVVGGLAFVEHRTDVRAAAELTAPFDPAAMDTSASACKDFFTYATGTWRAAHPIPAAYTEYGYIEALTDETLGIVRSVLEDAAAHPGDAGTDTQKIGMFYASCMDTAQIEKAGLAPIAPELARIAALPDNAAVAAEFDRLHAIGVDAGMRVGGGANPHDSEHVIANVGQGGIGLPERDYYTRTDEKSAALRTQYQAHVATMLQLAGDADATAEAAAIVGLETTLAKASLRAADRRVPANTDHPFSLAAIDAAHPHVALGAYFREAGIPTTGVVNVGSPAFMDALDGALVSVPTSTWKAYLRWHLLHAYASQLPSRFADANFAFFSTTLRGQKEDQPRWKRCVAATDQVLGEAVGRAYVAKTFPPQAKERAVAMTLRIRDAFKAEVAALDWMTPATKKIALAKLDAMRMQVGYPDKWRDYSKYYVTLRPYASNVIGGRVFEHAYGLSRIGKTVDHAQWGMTPQTVNAYNSPTENKIVLPAAQLQPPFFGADAPDADNLGATGAGTVGHEMTHGFDDQGHKYDLHGNLANWWTPTDLARFDERAGCVIKQFDDTVAVGDVHYQGKLVSGEAIADLGGVVIGYRALEDSLGTGPRTKIGGFTPEQRYFLAYAQSWTESVRPEAARANALTDPHPLPRDRVNVTVADVPGWYEAFNCPKPPKPICSVW
jgi:predicted metalloendopeptidase